MIPPELLPEGTEVVLQYSTPGGQPGKEGVMGAQVRLLQYEVREGSEADEAVIIPTAFIANRNSSFILLEVESVQAVRASTPRSEVYGEDEGF